MKAIKFKTHYYELNALAKCMDSYPPTGMDIQSHLIASILIELRPKLEQKLYAWSGDAKSKRHTMTWSNHTARTVAIYLSRAIGSGLIANDHDRSCADMLRLNLTQKLA